MLTTRFEEICMMKDEFDELYEELNDIVNLSFNLGEKILENQVVKKVMRSLRPKVTAIERAKTWIK